MIPNSMKFRAASALNAVGVVLVLANWYVKPDAVLAWTVALAVFAMMGAALRMSRRAGPRTVATVGTRSLDQIAISVVFAAVMMGIPLALALARSYGLVDGSDVARRSVGVLTSAFLVMLGNVMPKNLPPLSPGFDGARQQAFHRHVGWTWVVGGLASAIGWLVLPIDSAATTMIVLMVMALAVTIIHLVRLASRAKNSPLPAEPGTHR